MRTRISKTTPVQSHCQRLLGFSTALLMACGSAGNKLASGSDAGAPGRGGESGNDSGEGGGGSGSGAGDECQALAACCEVLASEQEACRTTAAQQSSSICGLALSRYATECPELAFPDDHGTTSDGWKYYPAWSNQRVSGFAQRQGGLLSMFLSRDGTLYGNTASHFSRSVDHGASWVQLGSDRVSVELPSGEFFGLRDGVIVRSSDQGANFTPLGEETAPFVQVIVEQQAALFALTERFVERSENAGQAFVPIADTPAASSGLLIDRYGSLFVFGDNVIFRQRAGERRWLARFVATRFSDALELVNGTLLLAGTGGVYRSIDHGDSWQLTAELPNLNDLLATSKGVVLAVGKGGVYRSNDGGVTFESIGPTGKDGPVELAAGVVLADDSLLGSSGFVATMYRSPAITDLPVGLETPPELPARCFDGELNGPELELDCGGDCGECFPFEYIPSRLGPGYAAKDGSFYGSDHSNGNEQLVRSSLGHDGVLLGEAREIVGEASGALYALDPDVPSLAVSTDRGEHFQAYGPSPLPGTVGAFLASAAHARSYLAIGPAVYTLPLAGEALSGPFATPDGVSFFKFFEASDGTVYALAWNRPQNVYRGNAEGSVWTLVGNVELFSLADDAGTLYGSGSGGIYRLDGTSFVLLAGTEGERWNDIVINSSGTLFFVTDEGLVSYPLRGSSAGDSVVRLSADLQAGPMAVAGDRVYVRPYLSVTTTNW